MTSDPSSALTQDRDQVLRLIDFLAEYDAQRNKPVRNIADYKLFRIDESGLPSEPAVRILASQEEWLSVDFVDLPTPPAVPAGLEGQLDDGRPLSAARRPQLTAQPPATPAGDPHANDWDSTQRRYEDELRIHEELKRAAESFAEEVWSPWAERYSAASSVKKLHLELFEQRERLALDREAVELVWGFGRARWNIDAYTLDHPLITVPVEVGLDSKTQRITVQPVGLPEVEIRYLYGLDVHDRPSILALRSSLTEDEIDVWNDDERFETIKRLTRLIDDNGTVVDSGIVPGPHLRTADTWTLYLRRRVPDSQAFLQKLRDMYLGGTAIPDPLIDVVSTPSDGGAGENQGEYGITPTVPQEPPLLPLPANDEQRRILELAQRMSGVTVQGPPGTGKSHTIANLISHYVAYGQRVLVVSEKEQALKVLSGKIPDGIRDLTVSVLGADNESRQALERAVSTIQQRVGTLDVAAADSEINRLRRELEETDRGLAEATTDMLRGRQSEVESAPGEWLAGQDPTPQTAAEWVSESQESLDFVPDTLDLSAKLPLTPAEFGEYVRLLGTVKADDARAALTEVPHPRDLPTPAEVGTLFEAAEDGDSAAEGVRGAFADWQRFVGADRERTAATREAVLGFAQMLESLERSQYAALLERLSDQLFLQELTLYQTNLRALREQAMAHRSNLMAHEVVSADPTSQEGLVLAQQAHAKLAGSGKLGLFDGRLKKALASYSVDGHPARSADDAALVIETISLELVRQQIGRLYSNQSPVSAGMPPSSRPEDAVVAELSGLESFLAVPNRKQSVAVELYDLGIRYERLETSEQARGLAADLTRALRHFEAEDARKELAGLEGNLKAGAAKLDASPLWFQLIDALQTHDRGVWATLRDEATRLAALLEPARRLKELGGTLAASAPLWAQALEADPSGAPSTDSIVAGWQWRQLDCWIRGIANLPSPADLQARVEELGATRRRVVSALVEQLAWRRLKGNLGGKQHQALQSYLKAVTRYGKTGGKFAERWVREMREALNDCKDAVPVWVMTTSRALMSFQPAEVPAFDVLIVDEASQIGFEALPLLSLARKAIIVGDDKQTSPENVGLDRQKVFNIMDEHLTSIHKYKTLFDPDNSLYDLAAQKFSSPVMLSEHFRCLPEIIAFSNSLAYNNRIVPLRDQAPSPGWAPLGLVRVKDGYRQGDINRPEAEQVVTLIKELTADPAYDEMTFGVISLLGSSQSKLIWDMLFEELGPDVFEERRIRCGEAANFQGDERDVIIVSTVVAVDPAANSTRFGAMTSEKDRRRINVTASRARNQMWIVTSVDPAALPQGDFRAGLIQHCKSYVDERANQAELINACESEFERRVVSDLINRGFTGLEVQKWVGRYRLDIVVSGPERRLAIECDGDRWHGPDAWHEDRSRQEVLERAGWTFERIRGSAYFRDPLGAMEPVWAHLEALGIPTGDEWRDAPARTMIREVSGKPAESELLEIRSKASLSAGSFREEVAEVLDFAQIDPQPEVRGADNPNGQELDFTLPLAEHAVQLRPYLSWKGAGLPSADKASVVEVESALVEIVRVEGPLLAHQAYLRYLSASDGRDLDKNLVKSLNTATNRALEEGRLARIQDRVLNLQQVTLYAPENEPVVIRELGPRTLFEVPKSEIVSALELLIKADVPPQDLDRQLLGLLGIRALTEDMSAFLSEARGYVWRLPELTADMN